MVMLNFTCQEKKEALFNKSVSQTIRTDVKKFIKKEVDKEAVLFHIPRNSTEPFWKPEDRTIFFYPLHIWWNARNFHRKELGDKKFLGMGEITSIVKKKVSEITEEDAVKDGFTNYSHIGSQYKGVPIEHEARERFDEMCRRDALLQWLLSHNKNLTLESEIFIITWRWL